MTGRRVALPSLFVIQLGGRAKSSIFEVNETRTAIAFSLDEALDDVRHAGAQKWDALHMDGYTAIDLTDAVTNDDVLVFCQFGKSGEMMFERHHYALAWGTSAMSVARQFKQTLPGWHVDNAVNLSRLARPAALRIRRFDDCGRDYMPTQTSCYRKL